MNPSHRTASRFIAVLAAAAFALPIGAQAPRLPRGGSGGKVEPPSTGPATEYLLTPSAHPGEAPTTSRATTKLSAFETETTGRNRQVLTIRTPLGSGREAVSTLYPAPANGLLRVEREPVLGARSFRISARLLADGAAGLVGVALTDASLNHVLAGLVPDSRAAAPRVDLSRSTGEWTSIERGEPFSPRLSHWFRLELRVEVTAKGRRWALYAWQDGDPRPDKPTVTAIDQPGDGLLAELHASVWASGTGVRRIGDLLVQERPAAEAAARAASLDVPPEDEWPIEVIADDVHYTLADAPPDLTLPVDPDEPPPPDQGEGIRTASASDTAHIATTTCDMYRDHWDGSAPSKPGSSASLRLPPRDNDCDGAFDEDPTDGSDNDGDGAVDEDPATGDSVLRWTSTDSKLGTRTLTDAPAVLLRIVLCWPSPREVVAFASAQSGTWLAGLAQSQPLAGGSAIVGAGWSSVSYVLTPAASTPLQVTILESGAAFSDGQLFDRAVTFTAQTSGGSGTVTTSATIDGAPYTLGSAYDVEGSHTVHVDASDGSGGSASAEAGFAIDLSPPQFQNLLPASGALLPSGLVTVTGEVSADATSVTVAGQAATQGDPTGAWRPFSSAALVLPEGASTLTLTATDGAGRTASAELLLAVDSLAPGVAILAPAPAADACLPAGQPLTFSGSLGEAHLGSLTLEVRTSDGAVLGPAVTVSPDGRTWSAAGVDPGAADGTLTATVTATDALGRVNRVARSWRVDAAAPTVELRLDGGPFPGSAAGDTPPAGTEPTLLGRTAAPTVAVADGALGAPPAAVVTLDGQPFVAGTSITTEGDHLLVASAADCAGHATAVHALFHLDLTPPTLAATVPADGATLAEAPTSFTGTSDPDLASATVNGAAATVSAGSFTLAPFPWQEGENTVAIELVDLAGHRASFTRTFTVRSIPPSVEILETGAAIAPGTVFTRAVRPEIRANDPAATLTATLDGAPFASGTEIAATGDYTLAATVTDALGRTASASVAFSIDLSPGPTVAITAPADGDTVSTTTVDVTGTVTGSSVTVTVNGVPAPVTGGIWTAPAVPLAADDLTTLVASATDAAGRTDTAAVTVFARTGAPQVVILEPSDGATTNRSTIDVAGLVLGGPDATADGTVDVAGTAVALDSTGAWRALDVALADGQNALTVSATDGFGRTGSASVTVTVDRHPPTIVVLADGQELADGDVLARPVTVHVEVSDAEAAPHAPIVRLDGADQGATSPAVDIPVSAGGGHVLEVIAQDAAGNEARRELSFVLDLGGCTLTGLDPSAGSSVAAAAVTLRGQASNSSAVTVRVPIPGTDPVEYQEFAAQLADGTFLAADVPLPALGDNALELVCTGAEGATATTDLPLERLADGGGPVVAINAPATGAVLDADTVAVTGTVSDDGATVAVNGVAATVTPAGDGSATFTATLALVNGPNPLRAVAIDGAGRSGSARVVAWRDASAPPIQITSPASRAWVGPDGDGNAVVDVSGVIDLDAEPRLAAVVVASPVGQVTATVNPVTGAFTAPAVPLDTSLAPGTAQSLTATATDTLGHAGVSHVDVLYDATGPAIRLTAPADLARFSEASPATVAVTGDAWAAEGAQIDVNGAGLDPATLTWDPAGADGRHHVAFTAEIARPDADGAFAVVARVTGLDDRSATVRRLLSMDATAPTVVETVPADGAAGVDPNALVLALFSEPIRHDTLTAPDGLTAHPSLDRRPGGGRGRGRRPGGRLRARRRARRGRELPPRARLRRHRPRRPPARGPGRGDLRGRPLRHRRRPGARRPARGGVRRRPHRHRHLGPRRARRGAHRHPRLLRLRRHRRSLRGRAAPARQRLAAPARRRRGRLRRARPRGHGHGARRLLLALGGRGDLRPRRRHGHGRALRVGRPGHRGPRRRRLRDPRRRRAARHRPRPGRLARRHRRRQRAGDRRRPRRRRLVARPAGPPHRSPAPGGPPGQPDGGRLRDRLLPHPAAAARPAASCSARRGPTSPAARSTASPRGSSSPATRSPARSRPAAPRPRSPRSSPTPAAASRSRATSRPAATCSCSRAPTPPASCVA